MKNVAVLSVRSQCSTKFDERCDWSSGHYAASLNDMNGLMPHGMHNYVPSGRPPTSFDDTYRVQSDLHESVPPQQAHDGETNLETAIERPKNTAAARRGVLSPAQKIWFGIFSAALVFYTFGVIAAVIVNLNGIKSKS